MRWRTVKVVVMDGQGGKMGKLLVEQIKLLCPQQTIYAIGTNSMAVAAMLKAGADYGAAGENPVLVNARDADIIAGPIGIVLADALFGEITPAMARAVGESKAQKILIPINRCQCFVTGSETLTFAEHIHAAANQVAQLISCRP